MSEKVSDPKLLAEAFEKCQKFLDGPWAKASIDDFNLTVLSGGLSNRLYKCSLKNALVDPVLFRLYGTTSVPAFCVRGYSESVAVAVYISLANTINGPKLLGVFDGGRLEEYIPSHTITREEISDDHINSIVARKVAGIQHLHMPLVKDVEDVYHSIRGFHNKFQENRADKLAKILPADLELATEVLKFDFGEEIEWLNAINCTIDHQIVFCHQDVHLQNILVREPSVSSGTLTDKDIVFIDFDVCCYNYRGTDLGSHFFHRCFDYSKKSLVLADGLASEHEKQVFINAYYEELKKLAAKDGRTLDPTRDTIERLTFEVDFFEMGMCIITAAWLLCFRDPSDETFELWNFLKGCIDIYVKRKKEFIVKYPKMAGNNNE